MIFGKTYETTRRMQARRLLKYIRKNCNPRKSFAFIPMKLEDGRWVWLASYYWYNTRARSVAANLSDYTFSSNSIVQQLEYSDIEISDFKTSPIIRSLELIVPNIVLGEV